MIVHLQTDTYTVAGDGAQTFNTTHPGGSDILALMVAFWGSAFGDSLDTELYDGGAGTLLGGGHNNGSTEQRLSWWTNPAAGTKAWAWSGPSNLNTPVAVIIDWFSGVHQTTPIVGPDTVDEIAGAFSTPSHTALTAGADQRLFMATVSGDLITWPGAGSNVALLGNDGISASGTEIEGGTAWTTLDGYDTIEWSGAINSGQWASTAVVLNPSAGGPAVPWIARRGLRRNRHLHR